VRRVSGHPDRFELAHRLLQSALQLAANDEHDAYDRLLLSHYVVNEYPRLVSYRHLFEACASPLTEHLPPGQETGESSVSRRLTRFGGPFEVGTRRLVPRTPLEAVPLTPPSLPDNSLACLLETVLPARRCRFLRLPVKVRRTLRPKGPSIVENHSRL